MDSKAVPSQSFWYLRSTFGDGNVGASSRTHTEGFPPLEITTFSEEFVDAAVSHVQTWNKFFVHLPDARESFQQINAVLDDYFSAFPERIGNVTVGSVGAVKFGPKDEFFRILVLECGSEKSVKAFFVDFGAVELVDQELLHELPEELRKLPALAVPVRVESAIQFVDRKLTFESFAAILEGVRVALRFENVVARSHFKVGMQVYDSRGGFHSLRSVIKSKGAVLEGGVKTHRNVTGTEPRKLANIPTQGPTRPTSTTSAQVENPWKWTSTATAAAMNYSAPSMQDASRGTTMESLRQAPIEDSSSASSISPHDGIWMGFAALVTIAVIISWYLMVPFCRKTFSLFVQARDATEWTKPQTGDSKSKDDLSTEKTCSARRKVSSSEPKAEKKARDVTTPNCQSGVIDVVGAAPSSLSISARGLTGVVGLIAYDSLEREWKHQNHQNQNHVKEDSQEQDHPLDAVCAQNQKSETTRSSPFFRTNRATAGGIKESPNRLLRAPVDRSFSLVSSSNRSRFTTPNVNSGPDIVGLVNPHGIV